MAEFDATLSAMDSTAANIRKYAEQFKEAADQTYQAAQRLSESWVGDASQSFLENMGQLHNWMNQLSSVVDTYAAALDKAKDTISTADQTAKSNF